MDAFVEEVRTYCAFVEGSGSMEISARLAMVRRRLATLYVAALDLPDEIHGDDFEDVPSPETPNDWRGFAEKEVYWEFFDPYINGKPCAASLSDDVLDVYRDVKRGLELWNRGRRDAALWEWRFLFDNHWGDHAVDALRALHRACKIW